jgi:hypothetical protein
MTMAAESGSEFRNFMKVEKNCEEGSNCAAEFVVVFVLCFCWFAGSFSRDSLFFAIASPFWPRLCCAAKATCSGLRIPLAAGLIFECDASWGSKGLFGDVEGSVRSGNRFPSIDGSGVLQFHVDDALK